MIRIFIVTLFFCIKITGIHGQQASDICKCDTLDKSAFESNLTGELLQSFDQTIGSQYYYDWDTANITYLSGEVVHNKKLRYNGYLNEMIWLTPITFKQIKLDKADMKEVYFLNLHTTFRPLKINTYQDTVIIFVEVLYQNKLACYAHRKIKLNHVEITSTDKISFSQNVIESEPVYYLKSPREIQYVAFSKISRRSLVLLFPLHKQEVRRLLRKNNLSVKKEKDFVNALLLIEKSMF